MNTATARCNAFCPHTFTVGQGRQISLQLNVPRIGDRLTYVDDLAAERRGLDGLGITLGDDNEGDHSTLAQIRDLNGNLITFASPPKRPFPPA